MRYTWKYRNQHRMIPSIVTRLYNRRIKKHAYGEASGSLMNTQTVSQNVEENVTVLIVP
jgi:hypothetical protein